jgi:hypothetical protein
MALPMMRLSQNSPHTCRDDGSEVSRLISAKGCNKRAWVFRECSGIRRIFPIISWPGSRSDPLMVQPQTRPFLRPVSVRQILMEIAILIISQASQQTWMTMKISTIRVVQIVSVISTLTTRQALVLSHTGQIVVNIRSTFQRTCKHTWKQGELQVPRCRPVVHRRNCILLQWANSAR